MEPEKSQIKKKDSSKSSSHFTVLLLGPQKTGKTSFAKTITSKEDSFTPYPTNNSNTNGISHDSSDFDFAKKIGAEFTVFDTHGYRCDSHDCLETLKAILDYMKSNSQKNSLDAVILVMKLDDIKNHDPKPLTNYLSNLEIVLKENGKFINLIVVLTCCDLMIEELSHEEFETIVNKEIDFFKAFLDDVKVKLILWISPQNAENYKSLELNPVLHRIYKEQFKKLILATQKCRKIRSQLITDYREKLGNLFMKDLEIFLQKPGVEREPLYIPFRCSFTLKFGQHGDLVKDYEKTLNFKIWTDKMADEIASGLKGGGSMASAIARAIAASVVSNGVQIGMEFFAAGGVGASLTGAASAIGMTTGAVVVGSTTAVILSTGGIAVGVGLLAYSIYKIYKKAMNRQANTSAEMKEELSVSAGTFHGLVNDFILKNKLNEIAIIQVNNIKNLQKMTFEINEESRIKMEKVFLYSFEFDTYEISANDLQIKGNMQKDKEIFTLEWNFEKAQNQTVEIKLGLLLKIQLPKTKLLDIKLDEFLLHNKDNVWKEIKKKSSLYKF